MPGYPIASIVAQYANQKAQQPQAPQSYAAPAPGGQDYGKLVGQGLMGGSINFQDLIKTAGGGDGGGIGAAQPGGMQPQQPQQPGINPGGAVGGVQPGGPQSPQAGGDQPGSAAWLWHNGMVPGSPGYGSNAPSPNGQPGIKPYPGGGPQQLPGLFGQPPVPRDLQFQMGQGGVPTSQIMRGVSQEPFYKMGGGAANPPGKGVPGQLTPYSGNPLNPGGQHQAASAQAKAAAAARMNQQNGVGPAMLPKGLQDRLKGMALPENNGANTGLSGGGQDVAQGASLQDRIRKYMQMNGGGGSAVTGGMGIRGPMAK